MKTVIISVIFFSIYTYFTNLYSQEIILEEIDGDELKINLNNDSSAIFVISDSIAINGKIISFNDKTVKIKSLSGNIHKIYTLDCINCSEIIKDSIIDVNFSDITKIYIFNFFGRLYKKSELLDIGILVSSTLIISTVPLLYMKKYAIATSAFVSWLIMSIPISFENARYIRFYMRDYKFKEIIFDKK